MKLSENLSSESHLNTWVRMDVKKLIVAFRFAIALSPPMDSTSLLQEIISFFNFNFASNNGGWVLLSPDTSF
jgi:hypothetical protein